MRRVTRQGSQPRLAIAETAKTMNLRELETLEIIDPTPLEPWAQPSFDKIHITPDKEQALHEVAEMVDKGENVIYTDASAKDMNLGAAAVVGHQSIEQQRTRQIGIGPATKWTVHAAELIAISKATEVIEEDSVNETSESTEHGKIVTIVSDSQSAIQAVANPTPKSGQAIVHSITNRVSALRERRVKIQLRWIPAHSGHAGNETADHLAKQAVSSIEDHGFQHLLSTYTRIQHKKIEEEWRQEWAAAQHSRHLKRVDQGLPSKRALRVYGPLTRHQTYLLAQLRTGHSWLATYGLSRKFREDDRCVCGAAETVVHVVVDCVKLRTERRQLRDKVGDAFNSIASMLGGPPRNEQGKDGNGVFNRDVLKAILEFADASQRFKSRVLAATPRGTA
jgi:ribonuclease HI